MKNAPLTYKSLSVSNGWPMLSHKGRYTTNWYLEKILCVVFQEALHKIQVIQVTNGVIPTIMKMSIKNARFKPQPSTPKCIPLHQWEAHLLWKLMTKGERLYKDMKAFIRGRDKVCKGRDKIWKLKRLDMNMDKEGATLEKWDGSKFLDKRSTQVGGASSWTLIDCIWYVHIHMLACIALVLKFQHACLCGVC